MKLKPLALVGLQALVALKLKPHALVGLQALVAMKLLQP
jgi:hypothetical protein